MADATQVREDAGLGHRTLETTQRGFDPFIFADCDLTHPFPRGRTKTNRTSQSLRELFTFLS